MKQEPRVQVSQFPDQSSSHFTKLSLTSCMAFHVGPTACAHSVTQDPQGTWGMPEMAKCRPGDPGRASWKWWGHHCTHPSESGTMATPFEDCAPGSVCPQQIPCTVSDLRSRHIPALEMTRQTQLVTRGSQVAQSHQRLFPSTDCKPAANETLSLLPSL